jgi:hypothetical protein
MTDNGDPRIKIAYDESVRGWSLQSSVLDEIRSRTGVLLAATSVSSALLGSADLTRHGTFSAITVGALIAFSASVGLCVYVLWPTTDWTFTHDTQRVLEAYTGDGQTLDYMRESLALKADEYRDANEKKLRQQFSAFRWASVALGLTIVLWLIDLN